MLVKYQFIQLFHVFSVEGWDWALFQGLGCVGSVCLAVLWMWCVVGGCAAWLWFVLDVWGWVMFCWLMMFLVVLLYRSWVVLWLWGCGVLLYGDVFLCVSLWWVRFLVHDDVGIVCVWIPVVCGLCFLLFVGPLDFFNYVVSVFLWGFAWGFRCEVSCGVRHEILRGLWCDYSHRAGVGWVRSEIYYLDCLGVGERR